jgi:uncharacterized protein YkwD
LSAGGASRSRIAARAENVEGRGLGRRVSFAGVRRILVIAVVAAACSGRGPQSVGSQPSWRGKTQVSGAPGPVTFAPSSAAAVRYNERIVPPPPSALGDAIVAAVRDAAVRAGAPVPVADARLFRACAELAEVVPEEGVMAYSLVEFALQRNGIIEPSPHLLVVWGDIDSPKVIVEQIQPRLAEILADGATTRVGIGAAKRTPDGVGAVVFALQGSGVKTSPIPRSLPEGGSFTLEATVDPRYREPEVFVTHRGGVVQRIDLRPGKAGGLTAQVACGADPGKRQVEITASDAQGSTVLANFPVWCGVEPPATLTVEPSLDDAPVADPVEAERRVLALVNRDRQAAGLPALAWDERVADVARAHSQEMRRTKVVAHVSPTTGSAADRVRVAQIRTAVVLENVARAYGLGEAHQGLMNSPGHRANLMSNMATHVGIGIIYGDEVSGRREIFVTQVFTRVPPKVDAVAAAELVRKRIAAVRAVTADPVLASIAQDFAAGMAKGLGRDSVYASLRTRIDAVVPRYAHVTSVILTVADVDTVDGASLLGSHEPDTVGVGIAQGSHAEIGEGAIYIVGLLARRR